GQQHCKLPLCPRTWAAALQASPVSQNKYSRVAAVQASLCVPELQQGSSTASFLCVPEHVQQGS
ncbi:hypothetical protein NDU88_010976, partial [Pleurodeles waltl]